MRVVWESPFSLFAFELPSFICHCRKIFSGSLFFPLSKKTTAKAFAGGGRMEGDLWGFISGWLGCLGLYLGLLELWLLEPSFLFLCATPETQRFLFTHLLAVL